MDVLWCVYREPALHLSCSGVFPKAPRRSWGQERQGQPGLPAVARTGQVCFTGSSPCSRAPGAQPTSQKEAELRIEGPGSQCFLQ